MTPRRVTRVCMLIGSMASMTSMAADPPAMGQAFYRTELVIFARSSAADASQNGEILGVTEPPRYRPPLAALGDPASAYTLSSDEEWLPFRGEPATRELQQTPPATGTPVPVVAPPPTPAERVRSSLDRLEAQWLAESFQPVSAESLTLVAQRQRLSRAGLRVVWHGAWVQPVPDRETEPHQPVLLQAGAHTADGWEVAGRIDVTRGRFLHFDAELWMPGAVPGEFVVLAESRRLRSGELNYLDHPAFGVLFRIDPLELPPDLSAEIAALAKTGQ